MFSGFVSRTTIKGRFFLAAANTKMARPKTSQLCEKRMGMKKFRERAEALWMHICQQ